MWRRMAAAAAAAVCVTGLAACGPGDPARKAAGTPSAARTKSSKASPTPSASPTHYPDKKFGEVCAWNNGFVMSVLDAHRLTGGMVPSGDAWYTVTIRVRDKGPAAIDMPLSDFRPNALIGPHNYAAGEWTGDNTQRLTGTLTAGKSETGSFGYSVPEAEAGSKIQVQWMFSDDTEPCTFVGKAS